MTWPLRANETCAPVADERGACAGCDCEPEKSGALAAIGICDWPVYIRRS